MTTGRIALGLVVSLFMLSALQSAEAKEDRRTNSCPSGHHWVQAHNKRSYTRSDGAYIRASKVSAHCKRTPPSHEKWKERLKKGLPFHLQRMEKNRAWSIEDKEELLDAISDLPEMLLRNSVTAIYRAEKSSTYKMNPALGDDGYIVIYDQAFSGSLPLKRVIAHEMAHEFFRAMPDIERISYATSTDWLIFRSSPGGKQSMIANRDHFVEPDGRESVTEDFANNVEYYLFDPKTLLKKTPKAHLWLQKKFGDRLKLRKGGQ